MLWIIYPGCYRRKWTKIIETGVEKRRKKDRGKGQKRRRDKKEKGMTKGGKDESKMVKDKRKEKGYSY